MAVGAHYCLVCCREGTLVKATRTIGGSGTGILIRIGLCENHKNWKFNTQAVKDLIIER